MKVTRHTDPIVKMCWELQHIQKRWGQVVPSELPAPLLVTTKFYHEGAYAGAVCLFVHVACAWHFLTKIGTHVDRSLLTAVVVLRDQNTTNAEGDVIEEHTAVRYERCVF